MKYIIALILLTSCSIIPLDGPTKRGYGNSFKDKIKNCMEDFMYGYGTDIEKAYSVCSKLERGSN